jgi:hypothetical protein
MATGVARCKPLLTRGGQVIKHTTILATAFLSLVLVATADATPQRGHHRQHGRTIECNERGCSDQIIQARNVTDANGSVQARVVTDANGSVIGRRPAGCPHAFCGCEASLYLFVRIRAELNLASNWLRKFPRTAPASGMVAVRNHHVMVLMNHVDGNDWLVHDGNSGGGLTREHVRSLNGYVIVNPHGGLIAAQ